MKDGLKTVTYAEGKGFLSPIDEIIEDLRNGGGPDELQPGVREDDGVARAVELDDLDKGAPGEGGNERGRRRDRL